MRKSRLGLLLFLPVMLGLALISCTNSKDLLSGTWYSDELEMRQFTFYDDGTMKIQNKDTQYQINGETITFLDGKNSVNAVIDRKTNIIEYSLSSGSSILLYKDANEAKSKSDENNQKLIQDMQSQLAGDWKMVEKNVTAKFHGDKLTMTSMEGNKKQQNVYQIVFTAKDKVRFISGFEIVEEFGIVIEKNKLTFSGEDGTVATYIKKGK